MQAQRLKFQGWEGSLAVESLKVEPNLHPATLNPKAKGSTSSYALNTKPQNLNPELKPKTSRMLKLGREAWLGQLKEAVEMKLVPAGTVQSIFAHTTSVDSWFFWFRSLGFRSLGEGNGQN